MREDIQKMIDDFAEEVKKEELNKEPKYEDFERSGLDFDVYELEFDNKQLEPYIEIKNDINFESLNTSNFEFGNENIIKVDTHSDLDHINLALSVNNYLDHDLNVELESIKYETFKYLEGENYKFYSEIPNNETNISNFDVKSLENQELKINKVDNDYLKLDEINVGSNIPEKEEKLELPLDFETKTEVNVENKLDIQTSETEINLDRIDFENTLKERELEIPSQNIDFENELSIPEVETTSFNVPSEGSLNIKNDNFLAENNFALPQISFKPEQQVSYVIVKEIQTPVNIA